MAKLFMLLCARKPYSGTSIYYTASEKDSYLNIYPLIRTTSLIPPHNVEGLKSHPQFEVTTEYSFGMHPPQTQFRKVEKVDQTSVLH
jgi:hypothetical protein